MSFGYDKEKNPFIEVSYTNNINTGEKVCHCCYI